MNRYNLLTLIVTLILLVSSGCRERNNKPVYSQKEIERGKQLVEEGRCNFCHTPSIEIDGIQRKDNRRLLSGHPEEKPLPKIPDVPVESQQWLEFLSNLDSTVWVGPWGISFAANITPDKETGIGKWNHKDFIRAMRTGKHPHNNRALLPPMPWKDYTELSNDDLRAIFAYLQTLEPIKNKVPEPVMLEPLKTFSTK